MPNKKGSKVAASRARAQANAKKKARSSGPVITPAAHVPPVVDEKDRDALATADDLDDGAVHHEPAPAIADEGFDDEVDGHRPAPVSSDQRRIVRTAPRRERVALAAVHGGNLRREVAVIAILTALAGVTLAVLKLATAIGR